MRWLLFLELFRGKHLDYDLNLWRLFLSCTIYLLLVAPSIYCALEVPTERQTRQTYPRELQTAERSGSQSRLQKGGWVAEAPQVR